MTPLASLTCLLASVLAMPAASVQQQNGLERAADELLSATGQQMNSSGWNSFKMADINKEFILIDRGYPTLARFTASSGSLGDLSRLTRSGGVSVVTVDGERRVSVPFTFGPISIHYDQYSFQYTSMRYVGSFNGDIRTTYGLVTVGGPDCRLLSATLDTVGEVTLDFRSPPALVQNSDKIREALMAVLFQRLPAVDQYLQKAIEQSGLAAKLCAALQ